MSKKNLVPTIVLVAACAQVDGSSGSGWGDVGSSADDGGSADGGGGSDGGDPHGGPSEGGGTTSSPDGSGIRFDVGADGPAGEPCGCGDHEFSYIWIANSGESTVSKLNTRTLEEEGRYLTRPDANGNPSRTSVSIDGRAVAVANRSTGIVKIWARPEYCDPDANGKPGLQTSTGKEDALAWGEDDCIAWYTAFPGMTVQRPVAWTPGVLNEETCQYEDQKVWTVTGAGGLHESVCGGDGGVWVHRLDGTTGAVDDTIAIPGADFPCAGPTGFSGGLGPYGGTVGLDGSFWFQGWNTFTSVRVDFHTLQYKVRQAFGYHIMTDTRNRIWLGGEIFDATTMELVDRGGYGVAEDARGRVWRPEEDGIGWVDVDTLQAGDIVPIPGDQVIKGVAVDVDGYIWAVRGDVAYRIHPDTYELDFYDGLNSPYTYSDMAGGQIINLTCNPAG